MYSEFSIVSHLERKLCGPLTTVPLMLTNIPIDLTFH